ncbi:GNAT family N-acetyltransferase [Longimicrobium sp.]|uniref:GNAT family N-acetyltransferase n=1 Tax=Longimicrobium sp. TaxID=2029185 RepID=UPI002CA63CBC|nr:GNAT family N-acetyltransferase [Longimicrobium sp.]HSU15997.1 GNAT family N-acetyltransferase [Longimicrobium sp.]
MLQNSIIEKMEGPPPARFDCGRSDQNAFFHGYSWSDQQASLSTTYLIWRSGILAGFVTVSMSVVALDPRERDPVIRFRDVSALKLLQLGVDRAFQGSGLGRYAVRWALGLGQIVGEKVACRYVTLDAQPDLVLWYERQGFVPNKLAQKRRIADALQHGRDPERIAVSMRFDLRDIE